MIFIKIKEGAMAVFPIFIIVFLLDLFKFVALTNQEILCFGLCNILAAIGIGFFNLGADLAMTPMGKISGSGLTKQGKIGILFLVLFLLGFLVTIAEPNLQVLGEQVKTLLKPIYLLIAIAVSVGFFLIVAVLRMLYKLNLGYLLTFLYFIAFALVILVVFKGNGNLLPLAMDSGGVTTGPITVPFMMAICIGISAIISKKSEKEMNFGLIGLSSIGSIIVVLTLSLFIKQDIGTFGLGDYEFKPDFLINLLKNLAYSLKDVTISLALISLFFLVCNFCFFHLPKQKIYSLGFGILYTLIGLVLFLGSVSAGFMPIGYLIGSMLAKNPNIFLTFGFILGALTVIAEPAIHVLNSQVEEITGGVIRKRVILIGLMFGVGIALVLAIVRIIYSFDIMYYLIPGFVICLGLTFFIPKVYTAIAFDSGGVAAGALTSGFILPLTVGAAYILHGENGVLKYGFGIVALVALTPVLVIEILGLVSLINDKIKMKKQIERMISKTDEIIIKF